MEIRFIFQHHLLRITDLRKMRIRSVSWLEELVEDPDTQFVDLSTSVDPYPVRVAIGFSRNSFPVRYVFERDGDIIRSLYVRQATKEDIKSEFCRFCR
jgi:hypothetical protein